MADTAEAAQQAYLPRTDRPSAAPRTAIDDGAACRPTETILLVEDEAAVRALAISILTRAGYAVLDAATPARAEEIFERRGTEIDLVLSDVTMPGATGPALFGRLSARRPGLKVLYMSGHAEEALVRRGGISDPFPFLQKPFAVRTLLERLRAVLEAAPAGGER